MTADIELLPLPESDCQPNALRWLFPVGQRERVQDYARACVAHTTAAKDAEIEALRSRLEDSVRDGLNEHCRAERLEENLREARGRMLGQVKWVACDCGCERDKPADAVSVAWFRASALLRSGLGFTVVGPNA